MNTGIGTKIFQSLCDLADELDIDLTLDTMSDEERSQFPGAKSEPSESDLLRFYSRFGFTVISKDINFPYRTSMIRKSRKVTK